MVKSEPVDDDVPLLPMTEHLTKISSPLMHSPRPPLAKGPLNGETFDDIPTDPKPRHKGRFIRRPAELFAA